MSSNKDHQTPGKDSGAVTMSDLSNRKCVNHLEAQYLLSEKYNLLAVLTKYCDLQKENVFDLTPITFYVDIPNVSKETAYNAAL